MTAIEILLNRLYDTIETNEPAIKEKNIKQNSSELCNAIKEFIDMSFSYGHNLSYKNKISALLNTAELSIKKAGHEEWSQIKFAFMENDLHFIRKDRGKTQVQSLKLRLDQIFNPNN